MKKNIFISMILLFFLPWKGFAANTIDLTDELEKANKENINYYKENTISILKQQEMDIIIETEEEDKTKELDFKETVAMKQREILLSGLENASSVEEINKVISDAAGYKAEKEKELKDNKSQYITKKINKESVNVIMISAQYKTVRDIIFTFNKHAFYYYDTAEKKFIHPDLLRNAPEVKEFEKKQKQTIKTGASPMNTIYMLGMLFLLFIIPVLMATSKKHLARTSV
ncbi:hypothetical protein [Bacillus sp. OK048]|uniref:hypothetical protein n=1 Tax=Bacillus sp. OK048 TaxID=1882761 RepID=UPI0008829C2C|nr:hypothetical protein [Bacillus sp. OK048]SDN37979.1 hypothetical protein SAMN05443253_11125 [Bacillus sp. OK048]